MKFTEILGSSLKSDFLIELFQTYDVEVVYRYDRNHEGIDDEYVALIPEMGLEFLFDSSQRVTTLFMKKTDHNGYNPFDGPDPRSLGFQSGTEAMAWAKENSIDAIHQESSSDPVFGTIPEWVRFNFGTFYEHYQFNGGELEMVTLGLPNHA